MDKVFIRQPYNYDVKAASDAVAFESTEPTLTQQQFAEESDINYLVDRFLRTGEIPPVDARAMYGDFVDAPQSYQEALDAVFAAQEGFDALPAKTRQRFNNDPLELLSFLADPKNLDEAVELGLMEKPEPEIQPAKPAQTTTPAEPVAPGTVDPT
nr:MAG TPA: Scaffold protein [Microviridae sp.]